MDNFELIAITPPSPVEDEARRITALLNAGCRRVHIRHPQLSGTATEFILKHIPTDILPRITLHDCFKLAEIYGCGVQTNSRNSFATFNVAPVSASCHSLREARYYAGIRNYVTLSPVFNSISKPGYHANSSLLDEVKVADKSLYPPLIALGGITFTSLQLLRDAGFSGAAMLGEIWKNDFNKTLNKIEKLSK